MIEENIIKETCSHLNLTYKQLAESIGYGEGALKTAASTGKVSSPLNRAIEMHLELLELKAYKASSENIRKEFYSWIVDSKKVKDTTKIL
jgi:hypothetical protein